jgi:hypothetical protein
MEKILRYIGRSIFYVANGIHRAKIAIESHLFDLIYMDDHLVK